MRKELVTNALQKALKSRTVKEDTLLLSDRGDQYAGTKLRAIITTRKLLQSMVRADSAYDNVFIEACFSQLKPGCWKAMLLTTGRTHKQKSLSS